MDTKSWIKNVKKRNNASNSYMFISVSAGIATSLVVVWLLGKLLTGGADKSTVLTAGLILVITQIVKAIFYSVGIWRAHNSAYKSLADIRFEIVEKLKHLPLGFFQKRKTGELASILNHDVEQIEKYLAHTQPEIVITLIVPLAAVVVMFVQTSPIIFLSALHSIP